MSCPTLPDQCTLETRFLFCGSFLNMRALQNYMNRFFVFCRREAAVYEVEWVKRCPNLRLSAIRLGKLCLTGTSRESHGVGAAPSTCQQHWKLKLRTMKQVRSLNVSVLLRIAQSMCVGCLHFCSTCPFQMVMHCLSSSPTSWSFYIRR